MYYNY